MLVSLFALTATALALAVLLVRERRIVARAADRLDRMPSIEAEGEHGRGALGRLAVAVTRVETTLASVDHRLDHRHVLTGLPTREPLLELIATDVARPAAGGLLGAVSLPDFDRLAAFDPALAERVVRTLAERMVRMMAGQRMIAHVDRSHFAIWFGPDVDPATARAELDAIGYALGNPVQDGGRDILPEVRIGAAHYPSEAGTPPALLARALAMVALGAEVASPACAQDPIAAARDRYALEQDLRQAVSRGELELVYQPLIDAAAARVSGAEALLRWHHPERGSIPPAHFIPVMEAAGLAERIGLWTLDAAAREARGWQAQGLDGLTVAVNVSGHQLNHDAFSLLVGRTLARQDLAAERLEVELTETVAASDPTRAARIFDALRALGVRIAIDDFGTGFSSFSTLRSLRFDKIKIDREFVTEVEARYDSQAICQSIIALARGLGIRVLAEGVERPEEYQWLRAHGCAHFQGYYFARPLSAAAFVGFVRDTQTLRRLTAIGPEAQRWRIDEELRA